MTFEVNVNWNSWLHFTDIQLMFSERFCNIQYCLAVDNIMETSQISKDKQTLCILKLKMNEHYEADDYITNCETDVHWYKVKCEIQTTFKMIY